MSGKTDADAVLEKQRHECEVRHVANLRDNEARKDYLRDVRNARGHEAYVRLRADVWTELQKRKAAA